MLIRTTCAIDEHLYFITIGDSCFYLIKGQDQIHLIDVGAGIHTPQLFNRLAEIEIVPEAITHVYLSSDNPARIAGLPFFVQRATNASIYCSQSLANTVKTNGFWESLHQQDRSIAALYNRARAESMSLEKYSSAVSNLKSFPDGETISINADLSLRVYNTPGFSEFSTSYFIPELQFLIVDPTFGYFRGKEPPAPGANYSIEAAATSRASLKDLQVESLAFTTVGFISGSLAQKHIVEISEASKSLISECKNAVIAGVPDASILESLTETVYTSAFRDPLLQWQMNKSRDAIWGQIQRMIRPEKGTPAA